MRGVYTALITPFDDQDNIDVAGLRCLVRHQVASNVDGIVILGTTGESPTVIEEERQLIIETVVEEANGRIPIYVGCGSNSTKVAVTYAEQAQDLGANGVMIVTPYYNRPTQEGIYQHFKAVSQAISIPICIYNIPSRTGRNIEVSTMSRLAELPNIISVKESSESLTHISQIIEHIVRQHDHFTLMAGDDPLILPAIALGASGVVSVISNLIPKTTVHLTTAARQGNIALAQDLNYSTQSLVRAAFIETNPGPIKYMMNAMRMPAGKCRLPLTDLQESHKEKVDATLQHCKDLFDNELSLKPYPQDSSSDLASVIG